MMMWKFVLLAIVLVACNGQTMQPKSNIRTPPTRPQQPTVTTTGSSFYPINQLLGREGSAGSSQLLAALFGMFATGRVAPMILPILLKLLVLPLMSMVRAIGKVLIFMGTLAYLMSAVLPAGLTYLGYMGGSSFVGRAQATSSWFISPINDFVHNRAASVASGTLNYLEMDSLDCRNLIACKAGQFMTEEYPKFSSYFNKLGLSSLIRPTANNMTATLLDAMNGRNDCIELTQQCPSYKSVEDYMDLAAISQFVQLSTPTTTTTTTTTPPPLPPLMANMIGDSSNIVSVINTLGRTYFGDDRVSSLTSLLR